VIPGGPLRIASYVNDNQDRDFSASTPLDENLERAVKDVIHSALIDVGALRRRKARQSAENTPAATPGNERKTSESANLGKDGNVKQGEPDTAEAVVSEIAPNPTQGGEHVNVSAPSYTDLGIAGQEVARQLVALNRFTDEQICAYATLIDGFYKTLSGRIGKTVEELWKWFPLDVRAGMDAEGYAQARDIIGNAVAAAKASRTHTQSYPLFEVTPEEVSEARRAHLDIAGYTHVIDGSGIRHMLKSHGNAASEKARGNLPITDADFNAIPDVLATPDKTIYGMKNDIGRDMIVYLKQMPDGTILYLEEVRSCLQSFQQEAQEGQMHELQAGIEQTFGVFPQSLTVLNDYEQPLKTGRARRCCSPC
jgi:hypothetical protein